MPTVFVVDDDDAVRDALSLLIEQEGYAVRACASAEAFLAACGPAPRGCALLDLRMPEMDGLQLQAEMARRGITLPIVFLTGHGDIPASVRAVRAGAIDFLTKPIRRDELMRSLRAALDESGRRAERETSRHAAEARLAGLTEREREVMRLAIAGLANKEIARRLGISHRTVEIHKARIMHKTGISNLLELARLVDAAAGGGAG